MTPANAPRALLKRLIRGEDGVSAVEFALIAPVMILLMLGTFDLSQALDARGKITVLSRTVADFVTQSETITAGELSNIVAASRSIMFPYPHGDDQLTIQIESIERRPNGAVITDWSYPPANGTDRTSVHAPTENSVIRSEVTYQHPLKFSGFMLKIIGVESVTLNTVTYMVPRWGKPITANF